MKKKLIPTFAHGTWEQILGGIADGKLKYPSYCWIDDHDSYAFLNKYGELEECGIPKFTGSLGNEIVLSSLDDGLYEIKGQHKITADYPTTFDCSGYILVVVQTTEDGKKIRRITADELDSYFVDAETLDVTTDEVATATYLREHGYTTQADLDAKIAILKAELESEIEDLIRPVLRPMVVEIIDEEITQEDDENIRELFDE